MTDHGTNPVERTATSVSAPGPLVNPPIPSKANTFGSVIPPAAGSPDASPQWASGTPLPHEEIACRHCGETIAILDDQHAEQEPDLCEWCREGRCDVCACEITYHCEDAPPPGTRLLCNRCDADTGDIGSRPYAA